MEMFTRNLITLEEEATMWLEFYDALPDDFFNKSSLSFSIEVEKLKSFARVYNSISVDSNDCDYIIN